MQKDTAAKQRRLAARCPRGYLELKQMKTDKTAIAHKDIADHRLDKKLLLAALTIVGKKELSTQ